MGVLTAVVTDDARMYWPQFFGNLIPGWSPLITSFKVGVGGWTNPGPTTRVPDSSLRYASGPLQGLQDIDAAIDPYRMSSFRYVPLPPIPVFKKALSPGDMTYESLSTLRIRCFLDFTEYNDDGTGNYPELWEVGIFSDHPTFGGQDLMVAYGTFPREIKSPDKQVENVVRISFG